MPFSMAISHPKCAQAFYSKRTIDLWMVVFFRLISKCRNSCYGSNWFSSHNMKISYIFLIRIIRSLLRNTSQHIVGIIKFEEHLEHLDLSQLNLPHFPSNPSQLISHSIQPVISLSYASYAMQLLSGMSDSFFGLDQQLDLSITTAEIETWGRLSAATVKVKTKLYIFWSKQTSRVMQAWSDLSSTN